MNRKAWAILLVAAAAALGSQSASAHDGGHWRFGINLGVPWPWYYGGGGYYPGPAYYNYPPPVYYAPQVIYTTPPAPTYAAPPGYAPPAYTPPAQAPVTELGPSGQAPVAQAPQAAPAQPPQLYIYPRQGQSTEKQAEDRDTCQRWAVEQTGFDPARTPGAWTNYMRAMDACLDARGYAVR